MMSDRVPPMASKAAPLRTGANQLAGTTATSLQQRKTELHEFLTHTRLRLRSIAQSVAVYHEVCDAVAEETAVSCGVMESETDGDVNSEAEIEIETPQPEEPTVHPPMTDTVRSSDSPFAERETVDSSPLSPDGIDPLQRLNAIKLRLAQQIEES